jgi:hypothetical protein
MSDEPANGLHLPNLTISNFRGIGSLSIERLGRVTLLGGRNGVGKTTVLEAVRTYAARGSQSTLRELLDEREELVAALGEDHEPVVSPDYAALFHGRTATGERPIVIGPNSGADDLRIEVSTPADWPAEQKELFADFLPEVDDVRAVKVVYGDRERLLPWLPVAGARAAWTRRRLARSLQRGFDDGKWPVIDCESLGPGMPSNSKLARFWDRVTLTEEEDLSLRALRLTGDGIERIAVVGDENPRYRLFGRRVVVKVPDHARPVPLKSLGDGVTRLFAAALALANSRNGFLVVDEAENGIHYSIQRDFWRLILRAAHQYNVQVLATTHSKDCVTGFARAAIEFGEALGVYLRIERDGDQMRAVEYTEEELQTVADQGIEVR